MDRRAFVGAAAGALLTAPLAAVAQQPARVWRIGFLVASSRPAADDGRYDEFLQGMRGLGYVEGRNLVFEWRFADGNYERLPGLAAELVRLKVDLIVAAHRRQSARRSRRPPRFQSSFQARATQLAAVSLRA